MVAITGVEAKLIPAPIELPVVVPETPARILLAVLFPIVLLEIVRLAVIPLILIPNTPPATDAVAPALVNPPMVLFWILTVPVEEQLIPTTAPCVVVGVATRAPVPVDAPMIFPVTVPILTSPPVMLIPHNTPLVVAAPLLVPKLMAVNVLP